MQALREEFQAAIPWELSARESDDDFAMVMHAPEPASVPRMAAVAVTAALVVVSLAEMR